MSDRVINVNEMSWTEIVHNYTEANKRALVRPGKLCELDKLISSMNGWDVIFGKEHFFGHHSGWSLSFVERGSLLAHSAQKVREMGTWTYFAGLMNSKTHRATAALVREVSQSSHSKKSSI